ncbi:MAG: radical SAM/SPASM domain-containing protein [Promethearchaeota archaeon]|jgi:radical SAM protein with 4Fe4S-binding SPASM domain
MPNIASLIAQRIKPICAVWEITLKCDSKCIHCGSNAGKSRFDELNTQEALKLVEELYSCGYKGVALMGGEPLIREDWYIIAKEIKKFKMDLSIVSNGLNLIQHIQNLKKLNVDCVGLSLDGGNQKTHDRLRGVQGSFQKTLNAIKRLIGEKIPVSVITSVNKINIKELNLIKNLLLDRNIAWQVQICVPIGRFPKELVITREEFYTIALFIAINQQKYSYRRLPLIGAHCFGHFSRFIPNLGLSPWVGCQAGLSVLGIQSNGNIKGCLTLPDGFVEGNVRTQSLKEILNQLKSNKKKLNQLCVNCNLVNSCKGGCLGTAYALECFDDPYCLRSIEKNIFNLEEFPIRGKLDSIFSKLKNLSYNLTFK